MPGTLAGRPLRLRWPLVFLLLSIGLAAVAAVDAERAVRSQQRTAETALTEYAEFAAWSYGQHLTERLAAVTREALGAVNHGDYLHTNPSVPSAHDLPYYLPMDYGCMCHRPLAGPSPEEFFALRVGERTLDVNPRLNESSPGWAMEDPMPGRLALAIAREELPAARSWIADTLTRRVRGATGPDRGFTFVIGDVERSRHIFSYTLMPTARGDTIVYGARYSVPAFRTILDAVLDGSGLLPSAFTEGRRNQDIVAVRVRDKFGHTLYDSDSSVHSSLEQKLELSPRTGSLSVEAAIRPELAGTLLIGGLPRSHLPLLVGLLTLAAAMSVVGVVQLRREGELAQLRADFVSSVSHELRTPLAQIRLYVETLRLGRAPTQEQQAWSLGHIERETTRLTHLVENTLRYSRLGRDDSVPGPPAEVGPEVDQIVAEFRPLAESRRARIETVISSAESAGLRPDALRHVLINLLDNAVKYGPVGQMIRVTVESDGQDVRIAVTDEGPGVSEKEREQIWRPFSRGQAARAHGGSGIGLTIVREVAVQHGGRAWVEDGSPRGATFVVALPASRAGASRSS